MNDKELFTLMETQLYTGLLCDVLDDMGYREQAMSPNIRPLELTSILAGRAKTILAVDVYEIAEEPYKMEIAALDSVKENEVPVVCTNGSTRNGIWGELLSTATRMRGGRGAVIDGYMRDTKQIREMGFPVFSAGYQPLDSKGRGLVIDYDCPVVVGGVRVCPGDVIFADFDGVVVIPKAVAKEAVERALEKRRLENNTRDELLNGALLREVYEKYGVL